MVDVTLAGKRITVAQGMRGWYATLIDDVKRHRIRSTACSERAIVNASHGALFAMRSSTWSTKVVVTTYAGKKSYDRPYLKATPIATAG